MAGNRTLEFEILAETKRAAKNLTNLQKELGKLDKKISSTQKKSNGFATSFKGLAGIAAGFIGVQKAMQGVTSAVTTIANFEEQIAKLGAISKASAQDLNKMEAEAKRLGATTQYTASQVAEAMNFLAMAGYSTQDILSGTEGVLQLATIGMMDLGEAADIASNVLSGFGLDASETTRVVDVMAETITSSNTNVQELGAAMAKVAPVAASMNMSIEETASALGVMADAGIKAELAGTQLKMSLLQLGTDDKAATQLAKLGVDAYDAERNFKGLITILKELKPALASMTQEARTAALVEIFGKRSVASANVMLKNLDNMEKKFKANANAAGLAAKISQTFMDTLSGAYKEYNSALESVILKFSDALIPVLEDALDASSDWLRSITDADVAQVTKSIDSIATAIGGLINLVGNLNDLGMPDWLGGKKDIGLAGATLEAINKIVWAGDKIGEVWYALFDIEDELDAFGDSVQEFNQKLHDAETIEELDKVEEALLKQIEAAKKLIASWTSTAERQQQFGQATNILRGHLDLLLNSLEGIEKKKAIHKEQIESAKEAGKAEKELADTTKIMSTRTASTLAGTYSKRVTEHKKALDSLVKEESKILGEIEKLNAEHIKRLNKLQDERTTALRDASFDIRDIERNTMNELQQYNDTQREAAEQLSNARKALAEGDFKSAEAYFSRYKSLIRENAGEEIKVNDAVLLSKKQTRDTAIAWIGEEKKFVDEMYNAKVAAENEAHQKLIANKQAELEAVRAQINIQQQLLVVVQALVEALTGKTVQIDTTEGTEAANALTERIKELDTELEGVKNNTVAIATDDTEVGTTTGNIRQLKNEVATPANLVINAQDNTAGTAQQAKEKIGGTPAIMTISAKDGTIEKTVDIKSKIAAAPAVITISAQDGTVEKTVEIQNKIAAAPGVLTIAAKDGTVEQVTAIKQKIASNDAKMPVVIEQQKVTQEAAKAKQTIEKVKPKVNVQVKVDTKAVSAADKTINTQIGKKATKPVDADISAAMSKVEAMHAAIAKPSLHKISVNDSAVQAAKAAAQRPTSSVHTIHVYKQNHFATGGYVGEYQRLATGGLSGLPRATGKIPGHDLTGADDVPTLLTRGEFVQNVRAVDYYGASFMAALNSLAIPREKLMASMPRMADGGVVGTASAEVRNISLNFVGNDGSMMETMTDEATALRIENYFRKFGQ